MRCRTLAFVVKPLHGTENPNSKLGVRQWTLVSRIRVGLRSIRKSPRIDQCILRAKGSDIAKPVARANPLQVSGVYLLHPANWALKRSRSMIAFASK